MAKARFDIVCYVHFVVTHVALWRATNCHVIIIYVLYRVPATGTRYPRIVYPMLLWLADIWHANGL